MKLPVYWSKATAEEIDRDGKTVSASCWRWSDTSKEDAHQSALAAAGQLLQRLMRGERLGRYSYGQRPLREEVLETHSDDEGELSLALTRNSYGAVVLNTARVMFVDLDFAPVTLAERLRYFFSRLLGGKGPSPEAEREARLQGRLDEVLRANPDWGIRWYRTFAGARILVTHAVFDPAAESTRSLLESMGSDPLYVRLCQSQNSFRARLTPKPWRCGHAPNRVPWPHESNDEQMRFEQWRSEYDRLQAGYATCRLLGTRGTAAVHPEAERVIQIHDELTRCHEALPLA